MKKIIISLFVLFVSGCDSVNPFIDRCSYGSYAYKEKEYNKAVEFFTQCLDKNQRSKDEILHDRAQSYKKLKKYDLALQDYTDSILINPYAGAYFDRGALYHKLKRYDLAIADYSRTIEIKPHAITYLYRGGAYAKQQKYSLAIPDFEESLNINNDDLKSKTKALNSYAWLLTTAKDAKYRDVERAIVLATQAVKLANRKNAAHLDTLAAAYAEAGQFDKALNIQKEAVAVSESLGKIKLAKKISPAISSYEAGKKYY